MRLPPFSFDIQSAAHLALTVASLLAIDMYARSYRRHCNKRLCLMANTPSAKKSARKIEARTEVNKSRRSRVRTYLRKLEEAIASGNKDDSMAAFRVVESELMRAASKGVVPKNTASRKVSRMSARVKALSA